MEILSLSDAPQEAFDHARQLLVDEQVVALPTDTVYGFAALANSATAVDRLFELKRRPATMPIATLVASTAQALKLTADPPPQANTLMEHFWPGPLTIILPLASGAEVAAGISSDGTIGLRCPNHDFVRELAASVGPIAATSANLHGGPPCVSVSEIQDLLADAPAQLLHLIIDQGTLSAPPSTVVTCHNNQLKLLREGSITEQQLAEILP